MAEQFIIALGREYGTGGIDVAKDLANRFNIPLITRATLEQVAMDNGMDEEAIHAFDEKPKKSFFSRNVNGFSNSPEEVIAKMQADYLLEKAKSGESFVVLGRCAEEVLKDYDCVISIFLRANMDCKLRNTKARLGCSDEEALEKVKHHNQLRRAYHDTLCETKWGEAETYSLVMDVTRLNKKEIADILENFVKVRRAEDK